MDYVHVTLAILDSHRKLFSSSKASKSLKIQSHPFLFLFFLILILVEKCTNFPFREGARHCVRLFSARIFEWGYRGRVSLEIFNRSMSDPDPNVPEAHAERGAESWMKLVKELKLDSQKD